MTSCDFKITLAIGLTSRPHLEDTQMQCTSIKFPKATLMVTLGCFGGNKVSPPWAFTPNQLSRVIKTLN